MAFIPAPDIVQLTATFNDLNGIAAVNRFFCNALTPGDPDILELIATTYVDYWTEALAPTTNDNWSLVGVKARDFSTEFGAEFVASDGLPVAGTISNTINPNNVSATITWLTGFTGRSFRGRTYIVGLTYSSVEPTGVRLTSAAQANYQAAYEGLREAYNTAGHPLQVVSFFEDGAPRVAGVATPITAARCNFPVASQRRRLR